MISRYVSDSFFLEYTNFNFY